jgi:phytoene/squalene synthetase
VRNGAARAAHHLQDASAVTAELPGGEHEAVRVVVLGNGAL